MPPSKQGDYAYLLHIIRSLKSTGRGACILPHGVLFRGNAEAEIRRNLVRHGYIKGIIGLPANLFYGTGIPACIVVIDKKDAGARRGIFMIDASAGFMKDGPKNRLRAQDIHKIVDAFTRMLEIPKYSRVVSFDEIEKNDFNLNLPRYIDGQIAEDAQDIEGHLKGGIPVADIDALQRYWDVCPGLRKKLFKPNRKGYVNLAVEESVIKSAIFGHPEFVAFTGRMNQRFDAWRARSTKTLKVLDAGCHPKDVITALSENLLAHYLDQPLIDAYDVYQHLMDYWATTMQDDCYLIAAEGWKAPTYRVIERDKKGREKDKGWACDLVPKALIVARYFANEQAAIDQLAAELDAAEAQLTELEEENGGEEGALGGFDKINAKSVNERVDEIGDDKEAKDEIAVLKRWLKLDREKSVLKRRLRDAESELDTAAYGKYPKLAEAEIKTLVVDDKWMGVLDRAIHGEIDRINQILTRRVKELAERYATPLPKLASRVDELQSKVDAHLRRMGFAWA